MNKYSSYCITFRPKNGLSHGTQEALDKWLKKQDYYFAVTEMCDDAKHLHGQIWLKTPRARGEVCTAIQRIGQRTVDDWDDAHVKVMRSGIKIAYSDWYIDYLQECDKKNEAPNIICSNVPDNTLDFYPTEEEQEEVREQHNAVDKKYFKLERLYLDRHSDDHIVTLKSVQAFMANAMYCERIICVIEDSRRLQHTCKALFNYLNKSKEWQACATNAEINESIELENRRQEFMAACAAARDD